MNTDLSDTIDLSRSYFEEMQMTQSISVHVCHYQLIPIHAKFAMRIYCGVPSIIVADRVIRVRVDF